LKIEALERGHLREPAPESRTNLQNEEIGGRINTTGGRRGSPRAKRYTYWQTAVIELLRQQRSSQQRREVDEPR
jgi:hypothetical protein